MDFQYHKSLHDNPQIAGNPLSRFMQKQQIKRQYAKSARKGSTKTGAESRREHPQGGKKDRRGNEKRQSLVGRHPAGVCIAVAALLFIMVSAGLSSCGSMFSGLMNGIFGTSYTSEDSDLVRRRKIITPQRKTTTSSRLTISKAPHPGYDEYRYDLDSIGHNPHELASYLTALLQTYTPQSAQAELNRVFAMQYTLTLTEETEIRYRTETSTEPGDKTTSEDVPYEYHILNVKLTNKPISEIAEELLTPQQLEMYRVYLETSGNKPLIFGGGSPDMGASEDLSGVQLVNGTRPGNTAVMTLRSGKSAT